jgi:cyclopropane fatty-acyl-phospholipid synthase-like methyltransferase
MFGAQTVDDVEQPAEQALRGESASLPSRFKAWWAGPCPGRHPFKARLLAWWNGKVLPPPPVDAIADAVPEAVQPVVSENTAALTEDIPAAAGVEQWSAERVAILEAVYGEGALTPGGLHAIATLVRPFGLDPTMNVLEYGAGIGGGARMLGKEFDTWTTGIEGSQVLVDIAHQRAEKTGLSKKAPVILDNLEEPEIRSHFFNGIYSRDVLYAISLKDALLGNLVQGLKAQGMLTFIDYVAADDLALVSSEIEVWKAREPVKVHLWTAARYQKALAMQKMDVRTIEDISDEVCHEIISAWSGYLKTLDSRKLGMARCEVLVREAELWAARYTALKSGRLRSMRIFATKK